MMRFHEGIARIFELSVRQFLWSRRTLLIAAVVGSAVFLTIAARVAASNGTVYMNVNGADVIGADVFGMIVSVLFLRLGVPVLGVWYGTSLIADEVDEKTITYLFVRPVQRGAVLLGKYLAYLVCTALLVLTAVVIVYFALVPASSVGDAPMLKILGTLAVGLAAYGAVFAFMGTFLKRPLIIGLVFAFGWEPIALIVPGYLQRFTLTYHLNAIRDTPAATGSLLWLLVLTVGCLMLATWMVERREYALEQST